MTRMKKLTEISLGAGPMIDIADPKAEHMNIESMLRAADHINRFGGKGEPPVSVLRHSLFVAMIVDREHSAHGILHDLHECIIGEIPTPAAHAIGYAVIGEVKRRLDVAIFSAAGVEISVRATEDVKQADLISLAHEKHYARIDLGDDWGLGIPISLARLDVLSNMMGMHHEVAVDMAMDILAEHRESQYV